MYLWIGVVLHDLNTELITYLVPDIDNFWHAQVRSTLPLPPPSPYATGTGQGILTLFGRRMPLYILALYPVFDYTAAVAARRLHLPWWATAPAAGLMTVLMDIPYDIMGIKLLWWTWSDTDPNVGDRTYHVPWTSYYFHAAFAASFNLLLAGSRKLLLPVEYDWKLYFLILLLPPNSPS